MYQSCSEVPTKSKKVRAVFGTVPQAATKEDRAYNIAVVPLQFQAATMRNDAIELKNSHHHGCLVPISA